MKKLITLLICLSSFLGQAMAQQQVPAEPGANKTGSFTREDYSFMQTGDIVTLTSHNETCLRRIGNSGDYSSWYDWYYRFVVDDATTSGVWATTSDGLRNDASTNKHIKICGLKAGDRLYIEAAANDDDHAVRFVLPGNYIALVGGTDYNGVPYPQSTTQTVTTTDGDGNTYTEEVTTIIPVENWHKVTRYETYYVLRNCDLTLNFPQWGSARLQRVIIDSWNEAQHVVEDATVGGKPGQRFRFTSNGVLSDKRPAVPFLTVQIGSDNYKTYVQRYNGITGAATSYNRNNQPYVIDNNGVPSEGSFVYFFPDVSGTLYLNGQLDIVNNRPMRFIEVGQSNPLQLFYVSGPRDDAHNTTITQHLEKGKQYYFAAENGSQSVFHMSQFTFIPDEENYTGDLSYVLSTSQKTAGSASFTLDKNNYKTLIVKDYLGNVQSANVSLSGNQLVVNNIQYKQTAEGKEANKGGVILVYINPVYENGGTNISRKSPVVAITIPYGAEDYTNKDSKQIKVWDFYTNSLSLGKSTDTNSLLYQEMHYADGSKDWVFDNLNHHKDAEPVFKSVYEMEGDNADMIPETEGLIFNTPTNNLCIYNEYDPKSNEFVDRYVGIRPGGKLTIPQLKAGDRVRMQIGRYGGPSEYSGQVNAYVTMTNAKDVSLNVTNNSNGTQTVTEGKLINSDYIIGGTGSRISGGNCVLDGEYNFIVDHDGDFSMEVTRGQLIKFYRIEIYRSNKFITNNAILRNNWNGSVNVYELLYTDEDADGSSKILSYNLHNYGKGERIELLNVDQVTGNLSLNNTDFTEDNPGQATSVYFTTTKGQFGAFRVTLGVKTQIQENVTTNYITDRAERIMAIGYREKMNYPYTWDFTVLESTPRINLSDYSDISGTDEYIQNAINQERTASNIEQDNRRWASTSGYGLRVGNEVSNSTGDAAMGILFASGGQLYAKDIMFEETAGIGFKRNDGGNYERVKKLNNALAIADHGIRLNAVQDQNVYFKMVVPKVPANAVVYVKAQPIPGNDSYRKTLCSLDGSTSKNFDKVITGLGDDGLDNVYIMKNDGTVRDIELWLNGLLIQKIGVSIKEDQKTIGSTGFVSESRDHKIDHSLTSEFTGLPIKAYIVTGIGESTDTNPDNHTVNVREVGVLQENQGCFIANDMEAAYVEGENKSVDILDGKTHLFVPAIHNMDENNNYTNLMQPMINGGTIQQKSNGKINYALSNKYHSASNPTQDTYGKVGFYRADRNTGATIPANGAYLAIDEPVANNANAFYLRLEGTEEPLAEDFGDQDITAVKGIENAAALEGDWYNMNGQKLNGRPNASGIYVVNGKKVVIK